MTSGSEGVDEQTAFTAKLYAVLDSKLPTVAAFPLSVALIGMLSFGSESIPSQPAPKTENIWKLFMSLACTQVRVIVLVSLVVMIKFDGGSGPVKNSIDC